MKFIMLKCYDQVEQVLCDTEEAGKTQLFSVSRKVSFSEL